MKKIVTKTELAITFEVYNELLMAKEFGYDFVDEIINQGLRVIHLDSDSIRDYEHMKEKLSNLHTGELTSILLCKKEGVDFATNDKKAKMFCKEVGVDWLDIVDILRLCYFKCVLDRKEIETLISEIEDKDRTRITRVEEIIDNDVC